MQTYHKLHDRYDRRGLVVSEVFYSIQGEGITVGVPSVFLRLAGCNLLCEGADWRCDTIEVWRKGTFTAFWDVLTEPEIQRLKNGAHLVITGGEPMKQQKVIHEYLEWLRMHYDFVPVTEVETNGTVEPIKWMRQNIDHWNVSFKLASSGAGSWDKRINEVALKMLGNRRMMWGSVWFKIVIASEADTLELINDFGSLIDLKKVILMPAGENQAQLALTRPVVIEEAKRLGMRYCDRLHIVIWNKKTGV